MGVGLFAVVFHLDRFGGGAGLFHRIRYHNGYVLPIVPDLVIFEGRPPFVKNERHARRRRHAIEFADVRPVVDRDHAGHFFRWCGIKSNDRAFGDGRAYRPGIEQAGKMVVRGVHGGAGDLKRTVDATGGYADDF